VARAFLVISLPFVATDFSRRLPLSTAFCSARAWRRNGDDNNLTTVDVENFLPEKDARAGTRASSSTT
jgi:hypothetical protein